MTDVTTRTETPGARGQAHESLHRCLHEQLRARGRGPVARMLGVSPLHPDARPFYRAALDELEAAGTLTRLPRAYKVLHSVSIGEGDSDIDHIVIGPPGIFTISTNPVSARGAVFGAKRAAELIRRASGGTVKVTPLLLASAPHLADEPGVITVHAPELQAYLESLPLQLRPAAVDYYVNAAEERSTWHSGPVDDLETLRHSQRFERLRQEVDAAHAAAGVWRVVGLVALVLAVTGTALGLLL